MAQCFAQNGKTSEQLPGFRGVNISVNHRRRSLRALFARGEKLSGLNGVEGLRANAIQ
jgi:hypothetical protein